MFTLDQIVPWSRSFDEYQRMFALTDDELGLSIVGCGDGPASFNAEATRREASVISCDPIYRYDVDRLRDWIAATYDEVIEQTRRNADEFIWTAIRSVEDSGDVPCGQGSSDLSSSRMKRNAVATRRPSG